MPIKGSDCVGEDDEFQDSHEEVTCIRKECLVVHSEVKVLRRLSVQLEKRLDDQEDIIKMLKQRDTHNNKENRVKAPVGQYVEADNVTEQKTDKSTSSEKLNTKENKNVPLKPYAGAVKQKLVNIDNQVKINGCPVKTAVNKTNRFRPIIGNCRNSTKVLKTMPKMGHLHVYRCASDVSSKDLLDVLRETAPEIDFTCIEWNKSERGSSFRVSFPIEFCDRVYNPDLWPAGAAVRRFIFRKPAPNFQEDAKIQAVN